MHVHAMSPKVMHGLPTSTDLEMTGESYENAVRIVPERPLAASDVLAPDSYPERPPQAIDVSEKKYGRAVVELLPGVSHSHR